MQRLEKGSLLEAHVVVEQGAQLAHDRPRVVTRVERSLERGGQAIHFGVLGAQPRRSFRIDTLGLRKQHLLLVGEVAEKLGLPEGQEAARRAIGRPRVRWNSGRGARQRLGLHERGVVVLRERYESRIAAKPQRAWRVLGNRARTHPASIASLTWSVTKPSQALLPVSMRVVRRSSMADLTRFLRWRRAVMTSLLGAVLLLTVLIVQPLWAFSILGNALPGVLWRVETSEPLVALSFDDGPDPIFTPQVLDLLERHRAHATFFLIAERALPRPDLVARIRGEGHEVASHYTTRRAAWRDSNQQFADSLAFAGKVLDLPASRPRLFRPPGGIARPDQLDWARREGYTIVLGSAYPYDGAPPPTAYIRWLVTKNLAPGVIVILHDGVEDPSRAITALPSILDAGAARGLRFVTVGELIRSRKPGNG